MTVDHDIDPDDERWLAALGALPPLAPPADLADRFARRVRAASAPTPSRRWWPVALAAGLAALFATGWAIDHHQRQREVATLRGELATALTSLSAATRLEAVTAAGTANVRDAQIVAALTRTLLADSSENVRVAAADALGALAEHGAIAAAAERAFAAEDSPFVQAALLRSCARLDVATRRRVLAPLLRRADLVPTVRGEAAAQVRS